LVKVLGFDSWVRGSHHFERLMPAFLENGIKFKLVHLGSWGNDPGHPTEERIGDMPVADISAYSSGSIRNVLEMEKPDVVILLSTLTFAHRAVIRYCRQLEIPTLNLAHGLVSVQVTGDAEGIYKSNLSSHIRFVLSKMYKIIRYTLPCYALALAHTRASLKEWIDFAYETLQMSYTTIKVKAPEDSKTTHYCVYTRADSGYSCDFYDCLPEEITVVGNPDLIRFGLGKEMVGRHLRVNPESFSSIMYIDTALVSTGLVISSLFEFADHIRNTALFLNKLGLRMLYKPHPANDLEKMKPFLQDVDIQFVSNDGFMEMLGECRACIVETTTLALLPALCGMPLFYASYGALDELRFGPVLTSYPRGHILKDLTELPGLLAWDEAEVDPTNVKAWIAENVGPMPPDRLGWRVMEVVRELVNWKKSAVYQGLYPLDAPPQMDGHASL